MADEIVSALNGLSKTTQKLVDDRIAEAEKAEQDRKEQISALNKQIKDGDGRTKEIKEAKAELNQIKVDAKVAKSINLEVSRSSAAALGISEEELRARKEQLILQKDNKVATEQLAESIRQNGQIAPIVVRKLDDTFELIVGERRWRAASFLGTKLKIIVKKYQKVA